MGARYREEGGQEAEWLGQQGDMEAREISG
jgi:hypothetical protein